MMLPIEAEVPDLELLLDMSPEELGGAMIFALRRRTDWNGQRISPDKPFGRQNMMIALRGEMGVPGPYQGRRFPEVALAIQEAWGWLTSQALLVEVEQPGQFVLSRRALSFSDHKSFRQFRFSHLLPRELLHEKLGQPVWADFIRGDFIGAVRRSMLAVEVHLRWAAGASDADVGSRLAYLAFDKKKGPLTDMATEEAERVGFGNLFAGAMGAIRNPVAHRYPDLDEPVQAASLVMFANYLLREIDGRAHRLPAANAAREAAAARLPDTSQNGSEPA